MNMVQRCGRNLRGRDLIVGDIHGCFTLDTIGWRAQGHFTILDAATLQPCRRIDGAPQGPP
jgi:hypothetical protein